MTYAEHAVCLCPFFTRDRCSCRAFVPKYVWAHEDVYTNVCIRKLESGESRSVNNVTICVVFGDDNGFDSSIAKRAREKGCVTSQITVADLSDISVVPVSIG